jgi:hypothetical protein
VARALGCPGKLSADKKVYRVSFPRSDVKVTSYGVSIKPGLALGGYAAFTQYPDGMTLMMGDLVVTEPELQKVTTALQRQGIEQTAVHKHLLAHHPEVWWTHIHAIGHDAAAIARSLRIALDVTATPPARPAPRPAPVLKIDTAAVDQAMGTKGTNDGVIYKFTFKRTSPVTEHGRMIPPGMGVTTAMSASLRSTTTPCTTSHACSTMTVGSDLGAGDTVAHQAEAEADRLGDDQDPENTRNVR